VVFRSCGGTKWAMRTDLATRWPASANPSQALGYLIARHVPPAMLPDGLRLVREAAGWPSDRHGSTEWWDLRVGHARPWLAAAQQHARILGPPPGTADLLGILGDGVIRTATAARAALQSAGAGELADPRVLVDFARWCGADTPFTVLPLGVRRGRRVRAYLTDPADLARARAIAATRARHYGLVESAQVLRQVSAQRIRIDHADDEEAMCDLLGVTGGDGWMWPRRPVTTPLTKAMDRIRAHGHPIPVQQISAAIARNPRKRLPPVEGAWPLPLTAIRAWATAHPHWVLGADGVLTPTGPIPALHPHDHTITGILIVGQELSWADLRNALVQAGMSAPTAAAMILYSPYCGARRAGTP
jgi:hypothetical protein